MPDIQRDQIGGIDPAGNYGLTAYVDIQFAGEQTGIRQTFRIVQVLRLNCQQAGVDVQGIVGGLNIALNAHAVGVKERLVAPAGHTGGRIA